MKLYEYINTRETSAVDLVDELSIEDLAELIGKRCRKYIKLLGGETPLYRGMDITGAGGKYDRTYIGEKKVRKNRRALGTEEDLFRYINKWLALKKWPRRDQSVICTSNKRHVSQFGGMTYSVFPVGTNYGYAWIKANDFNDTEWSNKKTDWDVDHITMLYRIREDEKAVNEELRKFIYGNKGFPYAYKKGYEIWFDCNSYYFVAYDEMRKSHREEVKKVFKPIGVNFYG